MDNIDKLTIDEIESLTKNKLLALVKADKVRRKSEPTLTTAAPLTLQSFETLLDNKIKELSLIFATRVESIEKENSELRKEINDLKTKNSDNKNIEIAVKEFMNRESKKQNIVLFGVEENENEQVNDLQRKTNHVWETLGEDVKVSMQSRIGRRVPGHPRPRPIVVRLKDPEMRPRLLRKSSVLRQANNGLEKVFLAPDLTPEQQIHNKKLRVEVKRRRDLGEKVKIQGDRIITIPN